MRTFIAALAVSGLGLGVAGPALASPEQAAEDTRDQIEQQVAEARDQAEGQAGAFRDHVEWQVEETRDHAEWQAGETRDHAEEQTDRLAGALEERVDDTVGDPGDGGSDDPSPFGCRTGSLEAGEPLATSSVSACLGEDGSVTFDVEGGVDPTPATEALGDLLEELPEPSEPDPGDLEDVDPQELVPGDLEDVDPQELVPGDDDGDHDGGADVPDPGEVYREVVRAAGSDVYENEVCHRSDHDDYLDYLVECYLSDYLVRDYAVDYLVGQYLGREQVASLITSVLDDADQQVDAVTGEVEDALDGGEAPDAPDAPDGFDVPDGSDVPDGAGTPQGSDASGGRDVTAVIGVSAHHGSGH